MDNKVSGRIQTLDIIRGIALFGILVFNIQLYTLMFFNPEVVYKLNLDMPQTYAPMQFFIHVFIRGQAYTVYSFLFGIGFYLLWHKNKSMGLDADAVFRRRLSVLLLFGFIHGLLFWGGDILHKYALVGFTLIYFNKKSVPVIINWILGLLFFAVIFQVGKALLFPLSQAAIIKSQQEAEGMAHQLLAVWQHGTITEVAATHRLILAWIWYSTIQGGFSSFIHYEIMFLLGLIGGKVSFFERITAFRKQVIKFMLVLFPIGLTLKCIAYLHLFSIHFLPTQLDGYETSVTHLADYIGVPALTIAYLAFCSLVFNREYNGFFKWIANAGKLSLTNYLLQTLMCMVIFYGYGFGRAGKTTLTASWIYIFGIYVFQVLYSNLWVAKFGTGPIERLWRRFTYGKRYSTSRPGIPSNPL